MLKKGVELEKAHLYEEAANFYFSALDRKSTNIDAYMALQRVGKRVLNDYLNDFFKKEGLGETKAAVYAYRKASSYQQRLKQYNVNEEIADHYKDKYQDVKSIYLESLFTEGEILLEENNFKKAENNFNEILKFDPNYNGAKKLRDIAFSEPLYAKANKLLREENYREAYNNYQLVLKRIPNYKDAKSKKARALELGRHSFIIFAFENSTYKKSVDDKISSYISNHLSNVNDPFLRLVDRSNFERIMKEHELAVSGMLDENTTTKIGNLFGAQTAISGKVFSYSYKKSKLNSRNAEAFESFVWKGKDPQTKEEIKETRYRKVNYESKDQNCELHIGFEFKIISLETSEVLYSDIIELTDKDQVNYASSDKNIKKLYPMKNSELVRGMFAVGQFRDQFNARTDLKPEIELSNELCRKISNRVSNKVLSYIQK